MKVLFACGGTAGHINPALAVATELRRRVPDCEILFVGNPDGMEAALVPRAGFRFAPYRSMGIQRRFSWNNIKYNAKSVCLLVTARSRAKRILRDFAPDVVMGTGSYISAPILLAAAALRIPCMTHEANALPGVSNRMVAQKVDKFLLAVPEAAAELAALEAGAVLEEEPPQAASAPAAPSIPAAFRNERREMQFFMMVSPCSHQFTLWQRLVRAAAFDGSIIEKYFHSVHTSFS